MLLPGLMSSRTPNKSVQGLEQSQTERGCQRFHSFHTSYRKIRKKGRDAYLHCRAKHAGALCLIWKTKQFARQGWECLWDTGTDVFKRRHKRSCPRLGAKPLQWQLGDTGGVQQPPEWGAGMEACGMDTDGAGVSCSSRVSQSWRKGLVKDSQSHFSE